MVRCAQICSARILIRAAHGRVAMEKDDERPNQGLSHLPRYRPEGRNAHRDAGNENAALRAVPDVQGHGTETLKRRGSSVATAALDTPRDSFCNEPWLPTTIRLAL